MENFIPNVSVRKKESGSFGLGSLIFFIMLFSLAVLLVYKIRPAAFSDPSRLVNFSYCEKPINYSLGSIDKRFNLSEGELFEDSKRAASLWNRSSGREVLVYEPKATLTINFTFDERQKLNNEIRNLQSQIKSKNENIKPEIVKYEALAADFKQRLNDLNDQIDYWNKTGGAPEEIYNKLVERQNQIKKEADQLNQMARDLNLSTEVYNTQINQLNQTVDTFKETLTEKPEEGLYDGPANRIDIFFNTNKNELIHTLAHEMGHAIGLGHLSDPKSIMYAFTNQQVVTSKDDEIAIQKFCQEYNIFKVLYEWVVVKKLSRNF